jgi:glycine/D-amino acid oxidase-like deaminating enzyme
MVERWPGAAPNAQTNTPVTLILAAGLEDGEKAYIALHTPHGALRAGKVVIATNAYTAGLLPVFTDAIVPYKGMASHMVPAQPVHPHLFHTYNIEYGPSKGVDYRNPRPNGSVVVGGGRWMFAEDPESWYGYFNDHTPFSPQV